MFLKSSVIDELKRSKAKVYLAHGTADEADSVIGFAVLRAELLAAGRDVTADRSTGIRARVRSTWDIRPVSRPAPTDGSAPPGSTTGRGKTICGRPPSR
jgi:hypothetical protein